jgi:hypothetical protein
LVIATEGNTDSALESVSLAADVLDNDVAQFLRQRGSPFLGPGKILITKQDIKNIRSQRPPGSDGDGLVVQLAPQLACNLHWLNTCPRPCGEDVTDGLFNAALDFVQQTHGPSPFLAAAPLCLIR